MYTKSRNAMGDSRRPFYSCCRTCFSCPGVSPVIIEPTVLLPHDERWPCGHESGEVGSIVPFYGRCLRGLRLCLLPFAEAGDCSPKGVRKVIYECCVLHFDGGRSEACENCLVKVADVQFVPFVVYRPGRIPSGQVAALLMVCHPIVCGGGATNRA